MSNKIAVFEEIKPIHKWIVKIYISKGIRIYFFRLNKRCSDKPWIEQYSSKGSIEEIKVNNELNNFEGMYYDCAFDNVDLFYNAFKENYMIKRISELYNDRNIERVFKKALNEKLSRFYYLNYTFSMLIDMHTGAQIIFIPSNGIEGYRTDGKEVMEYFRFRELAKKVKAKIFKDEKVLFPTWIRIISYVSYLFEKFFILFQLVIFLPAIGIKKIIENCEKRKFTKSYKYAVMIISPLRQFANRIQKVDFLIDDITIKKNETIFISYGKLKTEYRKYMEDNELDYIDRIDCLISWADMIKILSKFHVMLRAFYSEGFIVSAGFKLFYFYLRWKGFSGKIKAKNLISYSDFNIQSIARNVVFKKENIKTFYYLDSANFAYVSSKKGTGAKRRHNCFGFLYYDFFISWCEKNSEYFRNSHCNFKKYVNLGCFWAQHLCEIMAGEIKSDFKNQLYGEGYKESLKIVSVFDSSFHDATITTYDDGIMFLKHILKLIDYFPSIFVVLKEKKPRDCHKRFTNKFNEILSVYDEIEKHERCFCAGYTGSSSEIMAVSDLTISFPFTSTTFEALSAGNRAIWHDASCKHTDTFYSSIPGVITHGYEKLLKRVEELLFKISKNEYVEYLNENIKHNVESYLDGKAITRFKALLKNDDTKKITPKL